jgi:hypothetical protein
MKTLSMVSLLLLLSSAASATEVYRYIKGSDGKYYILEREQLVAGFLEILASKTNKDSISTDFIRIRINCNKMRFILLANSTEIGSRKLPIKPLNYLSKNSEWRKLEMGTSRYNLVNFVCFNW